MRININSYDKIHADYDPSYMTRYVIIYNLINQIATKHKIYNKCKILDVGGYDGAIRHLMRRDDIDIVDIKKDDNLINYFHPNGVKLPFRDNSYDFVISSDTLEHIPPESRVEFVEEMLRVSQGYVIIAAPFSSMANEAAEDRVNSLYIGLTGKEYIWLKEHKDYGLPDEQQLEKILHNKATSFIKFYHSDLDIWQSLEEISYFLAGNIGAVDTGLGKKLSKSKKSYIDKIADYDFSELNGYRTFYVISKKNDPMKIQLPYLDNQKKEEFIQELYKCLGSVIQNLTRGFALTEKDNLYKDKEIINLNNRLKKSDEELNSIIGSRAYRTALTVRKIKCKIIKR